MNASAAGNSTTDPVSSKVIVLVMHGIIFRCLVSPEYLTVSWLLPGMVLAGGLYAAGQLTSQSLASETEITSLLSPNLITAVAGIGLNAVATGVYGVIGVVGAHVIFSVFYFVWIHLLVGWRRQLWVTVHSNGGDR